MYVVTGVTGNTGKVVAETLLAQKHPVRVIVRDEAKAASWRAKGAEVAIASLDDTAALTEALAGATGAYLLVPPQYGATDMRAAQLVTVNAIASAVKASGIAHVVALSSLGAQHATGTGPVVTLHHFERTIEKSAPNVTLLRAAYFLENVGQVVGEVQKASVYHTFLTVGPAIPMVSVQDIGETAAALLLDPAQGIRLVDLLGPKDYTQQDLADTFTKLTGREVKLAFAPDEYVVPALTGNGMPQNVAELFREMIGAINSGKMGGSGTPAIVKHGKVTAEVVLGGLLQHATA